MIVLRRSLVAVFLFGLYTNLGLWIGTTYLACLAPAAGLALLAFHMACRSNAFAGAGLLTLATALWGVTGFFSPESDFLVEHFKSTMLLMVSVLAAYGLYLELSTWDRRLLAKLFAWIALSLLFFTALEIFTPFRGVSDAARSFLYRGRFIYTTDLRDRLIAGIVRPKLFTQEPSHLAKALGISIGIYGVCSLDRARYWKSAVMFAVALYLVRSPTLFIAPGLIAAYLVARIRVASTTFSWAAVSGLVAGLVFLPNLAGLLPFYRAQQIASGADLSTVMRSTGPATVALETMREFPLAGAGIGGRELVQHIIVDVYSQFPGVYITEFITSAGYAGWGNAFFEMFVYTGIVFGLVLIPLLFFSLRLTLGISTPIVFMIFFVVMNFDSGFTSARPWGYFALAAAAIWASTAGRTGEPPRTHHFGGVTAPARLLGRGSAKQGGAL